MSSSTFLDYCLTCDQQITSGNSVYCSQRCRLNDLCTSPSGSNPSTLTAQSYNTPMNNQNSSSRSYSSSSHRNSNPFVLSPAYDFSSHRNSTASVSSTSSSTSSHRGAHGGQSGSSPSGPSNMVAPGRPGSGYFAYAGMGPVLLSSSEAAKKTLSPTSSKSSITSVGDDVRNELRMYESGFDQVRDWRRRRTSVYESTWRM